jgi:hypothetical protein
MASKWDRYEQTLSHTNEQRAAPEGRSSHGPGGQRHDRIHADTLIPGPLSPIAMEDDNEDVVDITAGQKMLSAVAGSILTALTSLLSSTHWSHFN